MQPLFEARQHRGNAHRIWIGWLYSIMMCTAVCCSAHEAGAQEALPNRLPAFPLQPAQAARGTRLPLLSDLAQVKLDQHDGQLQLVMMLESFRTEKRTGSVVTFREEQKTRMVPDGQGGMVEQVYTVRVPMTEEREVEVKIAAGRKPVTKPASQFRFLDLRGQELTPTAASDILQSLQPAFLLDRFVGELPEIPEVYRQALHESCLVIVTEEAVRDLGNRPLQGEILPARLFEQRAIPRN